MHKTKRMHQMHKIKGMHQMHQMHKMLKCDGEALVQVFIADSFLKRLRGYMFYKKPHHEAILFNSCNSIHTFFMKFPIDVLFVDENMVVVKKVEALKSGKMVMSVKSAVGTIEGEAGLFEKVKLGSKLEMISII